MTPPLLVCIPCWPAPDNDPVDILARQRDGTLLLEELRDHLVAHRRVSLDCHVVESACGAVYTRFGPHPTPAGAPGLAPTLDPPNDPEDRGGVA
jgi:hypothetical protein